MGNSKKPTKAYHRESKIQLMREASKVPELVYALQEAEASFRDDYPRFIGVCAAYVGIAVEGLFGPNELEYLEEQITEKLRKRSVIEVTAKPVQVTPPTGTKLQ